MIPATATKSRLAIGDMAVVRTELTFYLSILQPLIIPTLETIHYSLKHNCFIDV